MRLVLVLGIVGLVLGLSVLSSAQPGPVWMDVEGAEGARLRAAIFRPPGEGPFPLVLWLHGDAGLGDNALSWANDLASAASIAMAGCYFGRGENRVAGRDPCADTRSIREESQPVKNVLALIAAGKNLSGVRRDRVGLVGFSWGGLVAVLAASIGNDVQAVVSIAGALNYTASRVDGSALQKVESLNVPLLLIHGNADTVVSPEVSCQYEALARLQRKDVEAHYIPNAEHQFAYDARFRPEVHRLTIEFLNKHLRKP